MQNQQKLAHSTDRWGDTFVKFVVGCSLDEFRRYYKTLDDLHGYLETLGLQDVNAGELGDVEEGIIKSDPSHLIVWKENAEIIGHAIWHASNTDEHRLGDPRDKEDKEILRRLLGGRKDFIELHEIWLRKEHRGKDYGKRFFEFFEEFVKSRGYDSILYYTNHPAAIAICRKRRYKEDFLAKDAWHVFHLSLTNKA